MSVSSRIKTVAEQRILVLLLLSFSALLTNVLIAAEPNEGHSPALSPTASLDLSKRLSLQGDFIQGGLDDIEYSVPKGQVMLGRAAK